MLKTPNKTVIETTKNIVIKHKHKPFLFTQSMLENNMKQASRVFVKYFYLFIHWLLLFIPYTHFITSCH